MDDRARIALEESRISAALEIPLSPFSSGQLLVGAALFRQHR
jgi:hypothetical protein